MEHFKISAQKNGKMNEEDRIKLAELLIKAGYTVRMGRVSAPNNKTSPAVEYWTEEKQ